MDKKTPPPDITLPPVPPEPDITSFYGSEDDTAELEKELAEQKDKGKPSDE